MELFRDSNASVALDIVNATEVTATFIREGVVVAVLDGVGPHTLPFKIIGYDGPFEVRWDFFVPNDVTLHTRYEAHEVITPIVELDADDIAEGPNNDNVKAERLVRRLIEALLGQSFGFSYGAVAVAGSGEQILRLPKKMISLDAVSLNYAPYDRVPFGAISITDGGWALTTQYGNNYYPSIKYMPPEEAIYSSNGVITAPGYVGHWMKDRTYLITGAWGWEGVPQNVTEAAKLLIDDYGCDEDAYRTKYIDNMRSADWRIEYSGQTWIGTGNVKADQLLEPYAKSGIGVI